MRRKTKQESAGRDYVMGQAKLMTGHAALSTGLSAVNFKFDSLKAETREGFSAINVKLDRILGVLDTVVGKLHDNEQAHVQFGAMLRDRRLTLESHDLRLTSLESRVPPRTP